MTLGTLPREGETERKRETQTSEEKERERKIEKRERESQSDIQSPSDEVKSIPCCKDTEMKLEMS